jgi:copper chaperone
MTDSLELKIDGMHCGACVRRVTLALGKVAGLTGATVESVEVGRAVVKGVTTAEERKELERAVEGIGFTVVR